MLRWRLTLGLLATLIILLTVGIYGVWLFDDLGRAVDKVMRNNYDSIRACHSMRVATARVNSFYSRGIDRPSLPYDQTAPLDRTEKEFAGERVHRPVVGGAAGHRAAVVAQLDREQLRARGGADRAWRSVRAR